MSAPTWPDGTKRSTGNGFDLIARREAGRSIFATPAEQVKAAAYERGVAAGQVSRAQKDGPAPDRGHAVMPNLSERATRQLKAGAATITISKQADALRRSRARKASI